MRQETNLWEKLGAASSMLAALVGAVALIGVYVQIRDLREESKVQHLETLVENFDKSPLSDTRKELAAARLDAEHTTLITLDINHVPLAMYDELDFFEHVSLLANRGYLDKKDVWNEFSNWMFNLYKDADKVIEAEQKSARPTTVNYLNS